MSRIFATIAIFVAGVCTTAMNWRFSYQLGSSEWDSYTWATFSVALDVTKWFMLPFAALAWRNHKLRAVAAVAIWLVATIYSFTAAIGFAALNRETSLSERQAQADLHKTLQLMRQSPRWQSSAGCADATAPLSKEFCARYTATEVRLTIAPQEADPQSALFARITGLTPDVVRVALSIFLAIACEVISALGFFAIMSPSPKLQPPSKTTPPKWTPPKWPATMPVKNKNGAGVHQLSRPGATSHDLSRHGAPRRDVKKPPVATRGPLHFRRRRCRRQVGQVSRSRLPPQSSTRRPDKHRVESGEETSRPFRAALCADASRVCHRRSLGLSCRRAESQTSQLSVLGSIAMQPG